MAMVNIFISANKVDDIFESLTTQTDETLT